MPEAKQTAVDIAGKLQVGIGPLAHQVFVGHWNVLSSGGAQMLAIGARRQQKAWGV
jgi:hypothetical protein